MNLPSTQAASLETTELDHAMERWRCFVDSATASEVSRLLADEPGCEQDAFDIIVTDHTTYAG